MFFAPLLHPFDISGAGEVVLVFSFTQPLALAFAFRSLSTFRVLAVVLALGITIIWKKKLLAVSAFAFSDACHWPDPPGPM
jgi:hypothetical protein